MCATELTTNQKSASSLARMPSLRFKSNSRRMDRKKAHGRMWDLAYDTWTQREKKERKWSTAWSCRGDLGLGIPGPASDGELLPTLTHSAKNTKKTLLSEKKEGGRMDGSRFKVTLQFQSWSTSSSVPRKKESYASLHLKLCVFQLIDPSLVSMAGRSHVELSSPAILPPCSLEKGKDDFSTSLSLRWTERAWGSHGDELSPRFRTNTLAYINYHVMELENHGLRVRHFKHRDFQSKTNTSQVLLTSSRCQLAWSSGHTWHQRRSTLPSSRGNCTSSHTFSGSTSRSLYGNIFPGEQANEHLAQAKNPAVLSNPPTRTLKALWAASLYMR